MEDRDFIDFKFGNHWASDFNLLAVSSGDRYSPPVYGSVNPNTATIAGKVGVYKWKTQINEKVFNIKIAFDNINGQILNQIKEWLNPFKIDKLVFKEEPYKYYWVALNTEPKLDFLPFLEETKVVNGIAFKEGVYKGEFELQFVCFDNYGYSDWQSFDENYDYVVKEIEGEEFISFNDGSDNNLIITKIEGNSKQRTREEVPGIVISGSEMTINEEYISNKTQFVIDGNSEQKSYEGYNRLDTTKSTTQTINGVTITINENSSITFNGTMTGVIWLELSNKNFNLPSGDYTWSLNPSYKLPSGDYMISVRTSSNVVKMACNFNSNVKQQTLSEDIENGFIAVYIGTITTFNNLTIYPMLVRGTYTSETIPSYEPYVGGQPSPNPDYPQEIEVIDGVNEFNSELELGIIDINGNKGSSTTRVRSDFNEIEPNTKYTISSSNNTLSIVPYYYDKNGLFISFDNGWKTMPFTFTTPNNCYKVKFLFKNSNDTIKVNDVTEIQLIEGTTKKPYLPYGHIGLRQSGKNVFPLNQYDVENIGDYGVKFNINNDILSIKGTSSKYPALTMWKDKHYASGEWWAEKININPTRGFYTKPNTNYILSLIINGTTGKGLTLRLGYETKITDAYSIKSSTQIIINDIEKLNFICIGVGPNEIYDCIVQIQLEENPTATSYEPYHEPKVIPINLNGNSLAKVEDVKDLLKVYRNGDVEIDKKTIKFVKDVFTESFKNDVCFYFQTYLDYDKTHETYTEMNNYFKHFFNSFVAGVTGSMLSWDGKLCCSVKYGEFGFTEDMTEAEALEKINDIISNKPIEIYCKLREDSREIIKLPSIDPIELWEGTNRFELITNLDTTMELTYNYLPAVPSIEEPSEIRNVGDNIQLFDNDNVTNIFLGSNGEISNNSDWRTSDYIKVSPLGNYTLSWLSDSSYFQVIIGMYDSNKNFIQTLNLTTSNIYEKNFQVLENCKYIRISYSIRVGGANVIRDKIKLEEGTKATPWSPYGMGGTEINVCNNNIFDFNVPQNSRVTVNDDGTITINGQGGFVLNFKKIILKAGMTYYQKLELVSGNITGCSIDQVFLGFNSSYWISQNIFRSYTPNEDVSSLGIWVHANAVFENAVIKLWTNTDKADFITSQYQTKTIPMQKPFRAIENVRDKFVKVDGVWYEEHNILRKIFDGSENWNRTLNSDNKTYRFGLAGVNYLKGSNYEEVPLFISNMFKPYPFFKLYNGEKIGISWWFNDTIKMIIINLKNDISLDDFKSQLVELYNAGTPVYVDYIAETPELIPCTEEQSKVLDEMENNLYSYEGTNHIFSTNEVSPLLSISYVPKQDIYIDYVVNQSNLLNDSAFYYENNIHKKSYFDAETGDATKSGISEDRPVYLYNAGTTTSNLNLTFDMIIPAEGSPLVINTESCKLTNNGIKILKQISSISVSNFSKYKPFLEIYDETPSNWQIQIDSNLCEIYLKHKTDKTKIISLNKFNDNQSFLSLANCNFVDYSKPFPTLITAISGTALENTVFNKLSVGASAQNYRLKNVNVEWKHTYL